MINYASKNMFKGKELKQNIKIYEDKNNNGILDSQDIIKYDNDGDFIDNEEIIKIMESYNSNTSDETIKSQISYFQGTEKISLNEYNNNKFIYNTVDILSYFVLVFLLWFILFPKKL